MVDPWDWGFVFRGIDLRKELGDERYYGALPYIVDEVAEEVLHEIAGVLWPLVREACDAYLVEQEQQERRRGLRLVEGGGR